jgi:hypothetical protein
VTQRKDRAHKIEVGSVEPGNYVAEIEQLARSPARIAAEQGPRVR